MNGNGLTLLGNVKEEEGIKNSVLDLNGFRKILVERVLKKNFIKVKEVVFLENHLLIVFVVQVERKILIKENSSVHKVLNWNFEVLINVVVGKLVI